MGLFLYTILTTYTYCKLYTVKNLKNKNIVKPNQLLSNVSHWLDFLFGLFMAQTDLEHRVGIGSSAQYISIIYTVNVFLSSVLVKESCTARVLQTSTHPHLQS